MFYCCLTNVGYQAFFQMMVNSMYDPLKNALPLSMVEEMHHEQAYPSVGSAGQDDTQRGEVEMNRVESSGVRGVSVDDDRRRLQDPKSRNVGYGEKAETKHLESTKSSAAHADDYYGFSHPAASRPQRTVWIPKDRLGLSEEEERACLEKGIDISTKDAEMNEKGQVELTGDSQPPDMARE